MRGGPKVFLALVGESIESGSESIHGQMTGMHRPSAPIPRQALTSCSLSEIPLPAGSSCPESVSVSARSAGHRAIHSLCEKANLLNTVAENLKREFENIAACGVFNLHRCVGIGNGSGVAGMLEVIENLREYIPAHL